MITVACSWVLTLAFVAYALRAHLRLVLVARACHELRGPLFAVQLGMHGLVGDPARMAAIQLELARAGRALDDLSAAPRGRRGTSRHELIDLDALVESCGPTWEALASAYGATLLVAPAAGRRGELRRPRAREASRAAGAGHRSGGSSPASTAAGAGESPSSTVFGDPLRIVQACANLIGNAAEHGGGVVRVRVRRGGDVVRIEVADDGPGLRASLTVLTASARTRRGRRGHGLAIAATIASDHGGRLFAAPAESGARLLLELPAATSGGRVSRRMSVRDPRG